MLERCERLFLSIFLFFDIFLGSPRRWSSLFCFFIFVALSISSIFSLSLAALWLSINFFRSYKYVPQLSIRRRTHQRTHQKQNTKNGRSLCCIQRIPFHYETTEQNRQNRKKMGAREAFNIFICLFFFGSRNDNGNGHSSSSHSVAHCSDQCWRNVRQELNWIGLSATSYILH